ncbi:MAG: acetyl-CoA carboxylase carboxyltransferase subunit beta [Deltaproteobacteria bacterium]|nr:acetyl-CoA carboxylase carboxyltransferase subunit beta [Deltaproteobacteria bacterium]
MTWYARSDTGPRKARPEKTQGAAPTESLWLRCEGCDEVILRREVEKNLRVCPRCNHHMRLTGRERIAATLDEGTFEERDADMESDDPLSFKDSKRYRDRVKSTQKATGEKDAFVWGYGSLGGKPVAVGAFVFAFQGGSMGSVVGEKIARMYDGAREERIPCILFSASGGARMQEGILSLMQMAKTCGALAHFREVKQPYISVLTDPTTGGVAASFSMLGDVIIAEPKALVGFAGARVIEQTIRQKLPEGFQRAEFLLTHGMVDMVVPRGELRDKLVTLIDLMAG